MFVFLLTVEGNQIPPTAVPGKHIFNVQKLWMEFHVISFMFFSAGETRDGEPLFVGRVHHEGAVTIGKVQPSHGVCYIPYGGQEMAFQAYEILTCN